MGDVSSEGYDDGARGDHETFAAGELIVQLQPSATRRDLVCLARELGAAITDGGIGNNGIAGIDDAVVLQLGPRVSVPRTRDLLRQPRYANLIAGVTENALSLPKATLPTVNDPLFPVQWGLWNVGLIPNSASSIPPIPAGGITDPTWVCNPARPRPCLLQSMGANEPRFSMRMRSAWALLEKKPSLAQVNLAIIDDSLVQHEDLDWNVAPDGSAAFKEGPTGAAMKVQVNPGSRFALTLEGQTGCELPADAPALTVADRLERRYPVFCAIDSVVTQVLTVQADSGAFVLASGSTKAPQRSSRSQPLAYDISPTDLESAISQLDGIGPGNVAVRLEKPAGPRTYRVIIAAPDMTVFADGAGLQGAGAAATVSRDAVRVSDTGEGTWTLRFNPPYPTQPVTVTAGVGSVSADADITYVTSRWPGQYSAGSTHGQNIAGMIGATANNNTGITGVLGPKTNVRMFGLTSGKLTETAEAISYATSTLNARVVNMSLGWGRQRRPGVADPRQEDTMPRDIINSAVGSVPPDSRTLFVVAASNEAANVNDPGPRNGDLYYGQPTDLNPCRPKGMGVTQRPAGNGGQAQPKGGTLSKLQMPDGTYDRGNLLCVGAVKWNGQLTQFSMWGRNIIDVGAPGENIIGTNATGGYDSGSGTSYAAPYVSAVAAMVYQVYPASQPWLVKCAILSSATSQPLPAQNGTVFPFKSYAAGKDPKQFDPNHVFTVHGMVNGAEALSAAGALTSKVAAAQAGSGSWPTCVQKRRKSFFQSVLGRPGSWSDTPIAP